MGLESYQARYTYQLTDWTKRAYDKRGVKYEIVPGDTIDDSEAIVTGQVLDAHGRSYFGMSQMMNLVKMLKAGEITSKDAIFFEDMFQPGMESLPYILQQTPAKYRPTIYLRCLAQAIDPDDFVHVWGMSKWMSLYEQMCNEIPNVNILATNEEMVAHMRIANWKAPIYNISGLSFGKQEVQERVPNRKQFNDRKMRVVFGARWDQEKQPGFFMDMIDHWKANTKLPEVEKGYHLTDQLTDLTLNWIDNNYVTNKSQKPFFIYLSHYEVHTPFEGKLDLEEKYKAKAERLYEGENLKNLLGHRL